MDIGERLRDARIADSIVRIAEKSLEAAEKVCEAIKDSSARVQAYLNLYSLTSDEKYLKLAVESAESDEDYLRIVEFAALPEIAELIADRYRRDLAFAAILERSGDVNYALKISDGRILSAALKRLAARLRYPENLRVARMIPDAYYRCLALATIAERERIDLRDEIAASARLIENRSLRSWIERKLEKFFDRNAARRA